MPSLYEDIVMLHALVTAGAVAFVGLILLVTALCRPIDDPDEAHVRSEVLPSPFDDPFDIDVDL